MTNKGKQPSSWKKYDKEIKKLRKKMTVTEIAKSLKIKPATVYSALDRLKLKAKPALIGDKEKAKILKVLKAKHEKMSTTEIASLLKMSYYRVHGVALANDIKTVNKSVGSVIRETKNYEYIKNNYKTKTAAEMRKHLGIAIGTFYYYVKKLKITHLTEYDARRQKLQAYLTKHHKTKTLKQLATDYKVSIGTIRVGLKALGLRAAAGGSMSREEKEKKEQARVIAYMNNL